MRQVDGKQWKWDYSRPHVVFRCEIGENAVALGYEPCVREENFEEWRFYVYIYF
jgi:hypothetical protein